MTDSLAGKLLVASPKLVDSNFQRSVVYLGMHDENGAFGLVLNRPLAEVDLADHLPAWRLYAAEPRVLFVGGPVEPSVALGLGRNRVEEEGRGWTPMAGRLGLFDLGRSPDEVDGGVEELRVFAGYAGWTAGQLEAEIADDAWFVVDAEPGDPFTPDPEGLWRAVLRRQRGRLAMFAYFPPDPSSN